jgi:hypothetical protein
MKLRRVVEMKHPQWRGILRHLGSLLLQHFQNVEIVRVVTGIMGVVVVQSLVFQHGIQTNVEWVHARHVVHVGAAIAAAFQ